MWTRIADDQNIPSYCWGGGYKNGQWCQSPVHHGSTVHAGPKYLEHRWHHLFSQGRIFHPITHWAPFEAPEAPEPPPKPLPLKEAGARLYDYLFKMSGICPGIPGRLFRDWENAIAHEEMSAGKN